MAGTAQLLVGARPKRAAHNQPACLRAQRGRTEYADGGLSPRRGLHATTGRLADPQRRDQEDRQRVDAANQVGKEPGRGSVEPLHVVDHHHKRAFISQIGGEPVEPVQHGRHAIPVIADTKLGGEHRSRQPSGAIKRAESDRLHTLPEQLAHGGERRFHHQLVPTTAQHPQPEALRLTYALLKQRRFADARGALDHHRATDPVARSPKGRGQHRDLPAPLE